MVSSIFWCSYTTCRNFWCYCFLRFLCPFVRKPNIDLPTPLIFNGCHPDHITQTNYFHASLFWTFFFYSLASESIHVYQVGPQTVAIIQCLSFPLLHSQFQIPCICFWIFNTRNRCWKYHRYSSQDSHFNFLSLY